MRAVRSGVVQRRNGGTRERSVEPYRVLDLSRVLAGLWAAQTLADLVATGIKVEKPDSGDDTRSRGPRGHYAQAPLRRSSKGPQAAARDPRPCQLSRLDSQAWPWRNSLPGVAPVHLSSVKVSTPLTMIEC